eukprot:5402084-Amphidinium_carterae.1
MRGGKRNLPCYVAPNKVGTADYFHVGFLLESMGISLDEVSPTSTAAHPELRRISGLPIVRDPPIHMTQASSQLLTVPTITIT